jgi:hypothetical protein
VKVLSLHQPWASLIALGVKTIETRSWRCPPALIGQRIAIHAAKRLAPGGTVVGDWHVDYDRTAVHGSMFRVDEGGRMGIAGEWLPLGAIVCTAVIAECLPMADRCSDTLAHVCMPPVVRLLKHVALTSPVAGETEWDVTDQLPYGDFAPGRWAWMLRDVQPLWPSEPFRGGQGLSRSWDGGRGGVA